MILGADAYTVTRRGAMTWVNGQPNHAASSTLSVRGSLQPANSRDLEQLEAGARAKAKWVLICRARDTQLELGDIVTIAGQAHRVLGVQDWSGHKRGVPYRGYILEEVG